MIWSLKQYSKFESERDRRISDLLADVHATVIRSAVGLGKSIELLLHRFPRIIVTGVDGSEAMVMVAR